MLLYQYMSKLNIFNMSLDESISQNHKGFTFVIDFKGNVNIRIQRKQNDSLYFIILK